MSDSIIVALISVIGGGGLVGALIALVKVRPEQGQILVSTARDVVLIQRDTITDLRARVAALETERDALQARVTELERRTP